MQCLSGVLATILAIVLVVPGSSMAQFGPARIVTARAELRSLPATANLVGTIQPARRTTLGAEVAGLVTEMSARQGDLVEAGGLICRLNDELLQKALERELARLEARKARLAELENGTRAEIVARLKADLDAAVAMAERWDFELERIRRLHGDAVANEREYQDALAEKRAADSRRDAAAALHDEAVAGPRTEVVAQARFDVAEQDAEVARLRVEIEKTKIKAPFKGFVAVRMAEVGTWLGTGDPVVVLIDLENVLVRVDVPESAISYTALDSTVDVRFDALRATLPGRIKHIIPQADEAARTFPVEIELPNPEHRLKSGMFARATVPAGPDGDQLAVPKDALIDARGRLQVAVIVAGEQGSMAMPTYVTTGSDVGGWVAITSGNIPPGAEVAVYGNEQLVYPQPVQVVNTRTEVDAPPAESEQPAQAAKPH